MEEMLCNKCHAPTTQQNTVNIKWYSCVHCGYGEMIVDGVVVEVNPDNLPEVYQ